MIQQHRSKHRRSKGWFFIDLVGIILIPLLFLIFEINTVSSPVFQIKQTGTKVNSLKETVNLPAQAFILTDIQTGQVIYEKNYQQRLSIASISKIIPVYLIYQALESGKISLTDQVKIDPKIANLSTIPGLSNVTLNANSTYSVKELLSATLINSANAGIMALSQHLAPLPTINQKEEEFLKKLKINDFVIVNVNGLPNDMLGDLRNPNTNVNAENEMSAESVAKVATKLIKDFPQVLQITENSTYIFKEGTSESQQLKSTNKMLPGELYSDSSLDVVGLKTGTSDEGYSFLSTVKFQNRLLTTVILNATSDEERFVQTKTYLKKFMESHHLVEVNLNTNRNVRKAGEMFKKEYHLKNVKGSTLALWVPKNIQANDFYFKIEFDRQYFMQTKKPGLTLTLKLNSSNSEFLTSQPQVIRLH